MGDDGYRDTSTVQPISAQRSPSRVPKTAPRQPGGVTRSAELNHVESACGESPNTSPLTPLAVPPTPRPGASLIGLDRFPPPDLFEVEKACRLLIGRRGASLMETNMTLLPRVCASGGPAAAGMRLVSNLTLRTPLRTGRRDGKWGTCSTQPQSKNGSRVSFRNRATCRFSPIDLTTN